MANDTTHPQSKEDRLLEKLSRRLEEIRVGKEAAAVVESITAPNVMSFPVDRIVRRAEAVASDAGGRFSAAREEQHDRIACLLAERAKRYLLEWQEAEGVPDEETLLVNRLEILSHRQEGLPLDLVMRLRSLVDREIEVARLVAHFDQIVADSDGIDSADQPDKHKLAELLKARLGGQGNE